MDPSNEHGPKLRQKPGPLQLRLVSARSEPARPRKELPAVKNLQDRLSCAACFVAAVDVMTVKEFEWLRSRLGLPSAIVDSDAVATAFLAAVALEEAGTRVFGTGDRRLISELFAIDLGSYELDTRDDGAVLTGCFRIHPSFSPFDYGQRPWLREDGGHGVDPSFISNTWVEPKSLQARETSGLNILNPAARARAVAADQKRGVPTGYSWLARSVAPPGHQGMREFISGCKDMGMAASESLVEVCAAMSLVHPNDDEVSRAIAEVGDVYGWPTELPRPVITKHALPMHAPLGVRDIQRVEETLQDGCDRLAVASALSFIRGSMHPAPFIRLSANDMRELPHITAERRTTVSRFLREHVLLVEKKHFAGKHAQVFRVIWDFDSGPAQVELRELEQRWYRGRGRPPGKRSSQSDVQK